VPTLSPFLGTRRGATIARKLHGREGLVPRHHTGKPALRSWPRASPSTRPSSTRTAGCAGASRALDRETDRIARGLVALGIMKGDRVAVWATNVPEWIRATVSRWRGSARSCHGQHGAGRREVEYLLGQSETSTLFLIAGLKGFELRRHPARDRPRRPPRAAARRLHRRSPRAGARRDAALRGPGRARY